MDKKAQYPFMYNMHYFFVVLENKYPALIQEEREIYIP